MMSRRITPVADFDSSVTALGSRPATHLVQALMQRIAVNPAVAPLVNGTNVRALRTRGFGDYPAITLYYTFDEDAVYPLHVEPYDLRVV